jgi:hypothetical protein
MASSLALCAERRVKKTHNQPQMLIADVADGSFSTESVGFVSRLMSDLPQKRPETSMATD